MKSILAAINRTPSQFVTQTLEPTGGSITRPKDWFYTEGHRGPVFMWTLSREDSSTGKYTTGVRIQAFAGVKQGTGKAPKKFVLDFISNRKKEATKIIRSGEAQEQGMFTRVCLETEEGTDRILYSLFWGNDNLDIAIITIAGTKKELWNIYASTFDRMSEFDLIDMQRNIDL
jgi:hypothetical protein